VLAAAVGIDRAIEVHVGRFVAADDAARVLPDHFGARRLARLHHAFIERVPAIVECVAAVALESMREPGGRTPALERLQWNPDFIHGASLHCK